MRYKLVKFDQLSGDAASIYSVALNDEAETLLDKFIKENIFSFKNETKELIKRLKTIGNESGARPQFFKLKEGAPGDGVCALYDNPNSNLRLYCIHYGNELIIVGGGGHKPKTIRALQENEKLKSENYFLKWLSKEITIRIKEKTIQFTNDHFDFEGDLEFEGYEK
jgi:hypothetical protein